MNNAVIDLMLRRRSVRKYKPEMPAPEVVEAVVRAGQQAPFAAQLYSILLTRRAAPFDAPLYFIICVDCHKLERFMAQRGWQRITNDLSLLLFGIQDAAYAAENMVIAAESLGLGSCFIGGVAYCAAEIADQFKLPPRVFPLVGLTMGYPAEDFPPRPRYPLWFTLFEDEYPGFSDEQVAEAMQVMDEGYLAQGYYRKQRAKIRLESGCKDAFTYDNYSWTEHIARKWGQWYPSSSELIAQLRQCGFAILPAEEG